MSELKDILYNDGNKGRLPEDKLMAYLEGRLDPEGQREVEEWLASEGMESDALEGLQELGAEETKKAVGKINYELRKELGARNKRRTKHIKEDKWGWLAILLILLLAIVCYIAVAVSKNSKVKSQKPKTLKEWKAEEFKSQNSKAKNA